MKILRKWIQGWFLIRKECPEMYKKGSLANTFFCRMV
jgi:hypothetical protein